MEFASAFIDEKAGQLEAHRNADEADQLSCPTAKHHRVESEAIYRETVRNLDR